MREPGVHPGGRQVLLGKEEEEGQWEGEEEEEKKKEGP